MWPLESINVYYEGAYLRMPNFIADFYHRSLDGYKPPKTAKINIYLAKDNPYKEPWYLGSICTWGSQIDERTYLGLDDQQKQRYILDVLHTTLLELAGKQQWEQAFFEQAYQGMIDSKLRLQKPYPAKLSRDKHYSAQAVVDKTPERSTVSILFSHQGKVEKVRLLEKPNEFCQDPAYWIAQNSKWIDQTTFGFTTKDKNRYWYYSLQEGRVISSEELTENEWNK